MLTVWQKSAANSPSIAETILFALPAFFFVVKLTELLDASRTCTRLLNTPLIFKIIP